MTSPDRPAIRKTALGDAPEMSKVLVSSIRDLCGADHHDDPDAIANWLANKTPDQVAAMIASGGFFVALYDDEIAGVGAISRVDGRKTGWITLNYVAPAHRFKGISRAILVVLERQLVRDGARDGALNSTITAHRFYLDAGWRDVGQSTGDPRNTGYPMEKTLGRC